MKLVIAGGCGFVGTNLALILSQRGYEITCVDNLSRKGSRINRTLLRKKGIKVHSASIQSFSKSRYGAGTDVVLNCAAQSRSMAGLDKPWTDFTSNVEATVSCLELCRYARAKLIHWSTNKVYSEQCINSQEGIDFGNIDDTRFGGNRTIYGATKLAAEVLIDEWSRAYGISCIRNRFSCMAGPNQWGCSDQGWVAIWVIKHILQATDLSYIGYDGEQIRDVLHIYDVANLIDKQCQYLKRFRINEVYNVGGGPSNAISLRDASEICSKITGNSLDIRTEAEPRYADQKRFVVDNSRVSDTFGWAPTTSVKATFLDVYRWAMLDKKALEDFYA